MSILGKTSGAARMAVVYITVGALIDVWASIWLLYMLKTPPVADSTYFWCYGFLLTGVVLMVIGFTIGRIGRSAREAEDSHADVSVPAALPPEVPPGDGRAPGTVATAAPAQPVPPPEAIPVEPAASGRRS